MRRLISLSILSGIVLLCSLHHAYALGLGLHLSAGGGGGEDWNGAGFKTREIEYGGGIVFDTNLSGEKKFNYRLELDYRNLHTNFGWMDIYIFNYANIIDFMGVPIPQNIPVQIFKLKNPRVASNTLNLTNTFGFGIIRTRGIRFWLGPQFIIKGYLHGVMGFWAGTGLAAGVNFNILEFLTLSVSAAAQVGGGLKFYSHISIDLMPVGNFTTIAMIPKKTRTSQGGVTGNGMLSFSVMYRFGE